MKILHVIPVIAPRYGGPSTVVVAMCRALNATEDLDVELATTDVDGAGQRIDGHSLPEGFKTHLFRGHATGRGQHSTALEQWLRENSKHYDLIHTHALWNPTQGHAVRAARAAGVPAIVRPAGMLSPYTFARRRLKKWMYWQAVERKTIALATAFQATSDEEAAEIRRLRNDAAIYVVPNGVGDAAWTEPPCRNALRHFFPSADDGAPILLFLSRLHPKKGLVDLLLPALARTNPNVLLAVAGGHDEHAPRYVDNIKRTIARLGLQDRVALLGSIDASARWNLFDSATAFVLTSHQENFGVVVAEAMARGCPVIVSDAVQASTHVTNSHGGAVVPRQVDAIADVIDKVVGDTRLRREWSLAGRAYANANFHWTGIARQVRQMYASITSA